MSNRIEDVRPFSERVVIKKLEAKERMFGSIVIPQSANEIDTSWVAEVMAVGKGRLLKNGTTLDIDVKPGDKVVVDKYIGAEIKIDGEKYYIVKEDDILGVLEN